MMPSFSFSPSASSVPVPVSVRTGNGQPPLLLESYLKQLRLPSFLAEYQRVASEAARHNLSYEQFLLALAEQEVNRRDLSSIERCIRQARFPVQKELADFDFGAVPELPKQRILELAQGGYIAKAETLILLGNVGLGKSHVATGLAVAACRQGRRVRFYNAAGLVNELIAAQQEYRLSRFMSQALRQHVIVLDELGFIPFSQVGAQLLFQFCSQLYEKVSLIVTTNLRFAEWGQVMGGDERMSAALLDRLTHRAHILEFRGTSYRFRQQLSKRDDLVQPKQVSGTVDAEAVPEAVSASARPVEGESDTPEKMDNSGE
jgi:DNA replication protein DnaC